MAYATFSWLMDLALVVQIGIYLASLLEEIELPARCCYCVIVTSAKSRRFVNVWKKTSFDIALVV